MLHRKVRRIPRIAALLGVCALPAGALPPDDPCRLLTRPEITRVLGPTANTGRRSGNTFCEWMAIAADGGAPQAKKIKITLQSSQAFDQAKQVVGHGIVKIPAPGIGDDAVYVITPGIAVTLAVRRYGVVLFVDVTGFALEADADQSAVQAMERMLALDALAKM